MTTESIVEQESAAGPAGAATDEQLIAMLVGRAHGDGLKLTGEGGTSVWGACRLRRRQLTGWASPGCAVVEDVVGNPMSSTTHT